jgi:hypothetical protein
MNRDDGRIRAIPDQEQPTPREIVITEVERKVLETYKAEYRPELLTRWRDGRLQLRVTSEGPKLVEVLTRQQRRHQQVREKFEHKKRRRHEAALSRARNRR